LVYADRRKFRKGWSSKGGIFMPHYTAIVTLLAVAFYFFLATRVAAARGKFNVKHPATTGHPDFERVFRVHMNTLEWMPTFLVPLWLCAIYLNDAAAAVLGLVWIGGRVLYFIGYRKAVEKRLPGFLIQTTVCLLLFIGAIAGIVLHWSGG
jgi:glutathione S-transferase